MALDKLSGESYQTNMKTLSIDHFVHQRFNKTHLAV